MKYMINKIKKYSSNPKLILIVLLHKLSKWISSDRVYLKWMYKLKFGRKLNFENPQTFNEKLNWLKLFDRNPLYTTLADKYLVKQWVTSLIGEEYVVPCYGVWDNVDDIDIQALPKVFVLKTNHDSSGAYVVRNGILPEEIKLKYKKLLGVNYFYRYREWPYKNIKPKVFAEKCLVEKEGEVLKDYKFLCINGIPQLMYCTNKSKDVFENYYDMNFNPIDIRHGFRRQIPEFEKPEKFELMKELATKLSKDIPIVRVDFFCIRSKVYFAEYTFYDWGGMRPFEDIKQDIDLGHLITLSNINQ